MTYRLEKEENGKQALVIDGWHEGIAPDPYSGMGLMTQVDLENPGEVAVGYPLTTSTTSGGTVGIPIARSTRYFPTYGTPVGIPTGAAQSWAILDATGQVWEATSITGTWTFLSSSNSTTGSSRMDGIAYWLGYLFKFRNNAVDYWNGSTWQTGWKSINAGVQHYAYVATNNQLYFTNGNTIGRIFAPDPTVFDPTNSSTYDFNGAILELPVTDSALSLAEVGGGSTPQSTLLIGGSFNAIYPWDKISTSFSLPIYVADPFIGMMVSANQNAFIFPGSTLSTPAAGRGRIYITNGSQADLFYKIPDYIFGQQDPYFFWGDAIFHRNNLIFGAQATENSDGQTAFGNSNAIWALNLSTHTTTTGVTLPERTFRSISTVPLNSHTFAYPTALIGAVNPATSGFSLIVGWRDANVGGIIGYSGTTAGVGTATILTDLIPVGTFTTKRTFEQIEFKLRTPLASGESISITPIVDTVSGSTLTFSPTVTTGSISGYAPVNFTGAQWLQFSISLTGNSKTSGCRLKEIRIR